jgi:hypothetical protein
MVVHISGLDLDDLFVLLNGKFEHIIGAVAAARHIAERAQVNPAEQLVGFDIVGVALDDVLGFEDGVANASGLDVELGEAGGEELGRRIGLNGEPIFFQSLSREFATAVDRDLLLIHVGDGVVIVGSGAVQFARRSLWRFRRGALGVR